MMFKYAGAATAVLFLAAAQAGQASAQAPLLLTTPAPAGICSFNGNRTIGESTVGKYMTGRLNELATQVRAELEATQRGLQGEATALEGKKATLTAQQYQTQRGALEAKAANFERLQQVRTRELQETQAAAVQTIDGTLGPIVQETANARRCSVLLSSEATILGNPSMDISDSVIASLNTKITQFPIERVHLDQGQAR